MQWNEEKPMNILIIGRKFAAISDVKTYTEMWSYNLACAFSDAGVTLQYHRPYSPGVESPEDYVEAVLTAATACSAKAILAPGLRYFTTVPREIGMQLCRRFSGWVAQVYDGSMLDSAPVDITFTVRDDTWRYLDNPGRLERHNRFNKHVGWAANQELFHLETKTDDVLRIFVDHAAFDVSGFDHSLSILMNLQRLTVPYEARTLTDDGLVTIDPGNISVTPYRRTPVPATEFAAELRKSDVFIVTHPESLGLTVLEAAMCGALVLTPPDCLPPDRLELVNHMVIKSRIDWDEVIARVDRVKNAEKVQCHTRSAIAEKMLETFITQKPSRGNG
ncbi:glycosyltransferase family 4 protein [Escherichia coli]|nr:glycosyltransferase family 4 protein [Escherichia coli]